AGGRRWRLVVGRNSVPRAGVQRPLEAAAAASSVRSIVIPFADAAEIERGIGEFERQGAGGLVLAPDIGVVVHRDRIIALADRHRLPAAYPYRTLAPGGGRARYGTDITHPPRPAAGYFQPIPQGHKPA